MTVKNSEKPIANPSVVLREEFDDWAVLFDPDTGRGFGLNPTGVYLWKLLDGGHPTDALPKKIRTYADEGTRGSGRGCSGVHRGVGSGRARRLRRLPAWPWGWLP